MPRKKGGKAPVCGDTGAKNRRGQPCGGRGIRLPEGTYTRNCKNHGGFQQALPRGDPRRGGRPVTTGLYARHLTPDMLAAFNAAGPGSLDDEIRLAKSKLDWAVAKWQAAPLGGVPVNAAKDRVTIKPWVEIVLQIAALVRRLEGTRMALKRAEQGGPGVLEPYKVFLAEAKRQADEMREDEDEEENGA